MRTLFVSALMPLTDILRLVLQLTVMLVIARAFGAVMRRFKQPAVVGEMCGGIVLGPTLFGRLAPGTYAWLFLSSPDATAARSLATTTAMLLFLFYAGLEIDLSDVKALGKKAAWIGLVGTLLPIAAGIAMVYAVPRAFWGSAAQDHFAAFALFIGMNFANSANPVIARILMDLGLLHAPIGALIMTATIFDDLVNWTLFAVVLREIAAPAGVPVLGGQSFLIAFLAGVALSRSKDRHRQFHDVIAPIVVGVAPIYFISMGMATDFIANFDITLVAMIFTGACITKLGSVFLGAKGAGMPLDREAWAIGFGLNARGATGIVLAGVGLASGVIDARLFVAIVVMALATSLMAGPMMSRLLAA